jgi:hypothetical protein
MMRLYMIKRKDDGLFYVNINGHYSVKAGKSGQQWSDKGRFFRTPDGVAGNLRKLCSEPYFDTTRPDGLCKNITNWSELAWRNFDPSKLDAYEVVMMDVDIISMTATPARDFFSQDEAIAAIPLSRRERQAAMMENET